LVLIGHWPIASGPGKPQRLSSAVEEFYKADRQYPRGKQQGRRDTTSSRGLLSAEISASTFPAAPRWCAEHAGRGAGIKVPTISIRVAPKDGNVLPSRAAHYSRLSSRSSRRRIMMARNIPGFGCISRSLDWHLRGMSSAVKSWRILMSVPTPAGQTAGA